MKIFRLTYFFTAVFGSLMTPFWVIYFYEIGLNSMDIGTLIIFNYLGVLFFEIPTGALADTVGRKISVIISYIAVGILSILIYIVNNKYIIFAIFFLMGIAGTFKSGAIEAWFTEYIEEEKKYIYEWSKLESLKYIGNLIGFLLGSLFVSLKIFKEIWLIEGLGIILIGIFIILFGKEKKINQKESFFTYKNYINTVRNGLNLIFTQKLLFYSFTGSFFFFISSGVISLLWQPFLTMELNLPKNFLGIIMTLILISSFIGAKYSERISAWLGSEIKGLKVIFIGGSITILMMTVCSFGFILIFMFYTFFYAAKTPLFQSFINKYISNELRATVLSTHSLITGLSTIFSSFIFGFNDRMGFRVLFFISFLLSLFAVCFLYKIFYGINKNGR